MAPREMFVVFSNFSGELFQQTSNWDPGLAAALFFKMKMNKHVFFRALNRQTTIC